ncbi:hypothetical protein NADFUDRAFT_82219 [Nadsonia fulvescens var. elongata DSM 6958]|uniref:TFIIS N-terminal domain-containing protein n=1 Tax=Nadsonia fulvescens var. elongata DSM 6958 TaxID=857566 RepID=A0A1E3PLS8_9ASCO|nr:hypothetical protein NADFUDRAFT_82219 [Nadsonia fulvescens var. elongata DSM 6958]
MSDHENNSAVEESVPAATASMEESGQVNDAVSDHELAGNGNNSEDSNNSAAAAGNSGVDDDDDVELSDDDDELSDLDEEQFKDVEIGTLDDEVHKLKSHKKAKAPGSKDGQQQQQQKKRERTRINLNEEELSSGRHVSRSRGEPRQSSKGRGSRDEEEYAGVNEEDLDPEVRRRRELERRLDEAIKPTKKKKTLGEDDIEQMQDEKISQLGDLMRKAAQEDAECINNNTPATNKLNLLPQVRQILQKHNLADSILDNNLLEAIRLWLEPLPDASLPAYSIQKELFDAILKLPIKTIHLRESGLGKVVLFYQKSSQPQLNIKRIADKLVGDWSRPIMGKSDNYRDKIIATRSYDPELNKPKRRVGKSGAGGPVDNSLAAASAARRNRAHIPSAEPVSFIVAPRSNTIEHHQVGHNGGGPRTNQGDEQFRRMKMKMLNNARASKAKKSGVSIEGRGLDA